MDSLNDNSHRYRETPTWLGGLCGGWGGLGLFFGWFVFWGGLVSFGGFGWFIWGFFVFCLLVHLFVLRFSLTKPCGSGRSVVRRKGFFWQVAITIKLWSENQTVPSSGGAGCFWKETQRRGAQQIFKTFTT